MIAFQKNNLNNKFYCYRIDLKKQGIQLRRLGARNKDSDLRVYTSGSPFGESQEVSRRSLGPQALAFEITTKK